MKKHIPNMLTCMNLVCGCLAVVMVFRKNFELTAYLIITAALFDFADGFVARMLGVSGELGKQLDSLADMVTFGVVPGFVMYQMLVFSIGIEGLTAASNGYWYFAWLSLLIPVCSALRLAKFNIDASQSESFKGVPTPANAMLIGFLPLLNNCAEINYFAGLLQKSAVLFAITLGMSYLMISNMPLLSLKFKSFGFEPNKWRYALLLLSLPLLLWLGFAAFPLVIVLYVLLSAIQNLSLQKNT